MRTSRFTDDDFQRRPEGFVGMLFPGATDSKGKPVVDPNSHPELAKVNKHYDALAKQQQQQRGKAEEKAVQEAQKAIEAAGE